MSLPIPSPTVAFRISALRDWGSGSVGAWEHGSVGAWEHGSVGAWERGSVGAWEHGRGAWERRITGDGDLTCYGN